MNKITKDYELTNKEENLIVSNGKIVLTDNRKEGHSIVTVKEGAILIYKARGNTNKKFFVEKNAKIECYDIGSEVSVNSELIGEGASFNHFGLLIGTGTWKIAVHHKAEQTMSDLNIRTILNKKEKADIDGLIKIDKSCKGANGNQRIDSLMLDKTAIVKALPRLEIATDDVSCSHAAAIHQLNEESLFYLQSRGIEKDNARKLLIDGFMNFNKIITSMIEETK